jgi:hypothetical protein
MTTPKELYESLLSSTPNLHREPTPFPKDLLDFMMKLGHPIDETEGSLFDLIREVPELIAKRHPKEFEQFIANDEFFYVGLLDLSEVNAKAIPAPNGGWLIVLNWGLPTFLFEVARAICTRFVAQDSDGNRPFGESLPDFEETCRWIAETFAWYRGVGRPAGFDFSIHPAQVMVAGDLAIFAEQFVVSHEMAHFLAGHIETPFNGRKHMANLTTEVPSSSREQELEADRVGLRILYGKDDPALWGEQVDAYTGADFFLQVMSLFEELAGIPLAETHPPSRLRLERLRDYARSLCVDNDSWLNLFQRTRALEQLFAQVRKTLLEPSPEQVRKAKQIANRAREKFEQLLEACASGTIPNYLSFSREVVNMLSEYPSDAVCAAIAYSMDRIENHLETFYQQDHKQGDWSALKKFKLLIHLLDLTPLPDGVRDAIESMREKHSG